MPEPCGIQIKRVAGFDLQAFSLALNGLPAVKVTRPGPFGNPFLVSMFGLEHAIALHRAWLETDTAEDLGYHGVRAARLNEKRAEVMRLLPTLRGKNLACFCPVPAPHERDRCHRAILLELANR